MKKYESLSITIQRFDAQDVITASCVCTKYNACWFPNDSDPLKEGMDIIRHSNGCTADLHHCISDRYDIVSPNS